jgi:adenylyltransferase/sulfurtransferase
MKKRFFIFFFVMVLIVSLSAFSIVTCSTDASEEVIMTDETTAKGETMAEQSTESEATNEEKMVDNEMVEDEAATGYMDVTPEEAKKLIDENPELIIIDVSPNYDEGHIPGAINYYMGDGSLDSAIPDLDPEADYLVYCHVDSVSIAGAQALVDAGFQNVYRLAGNYSAWVDAGYPVEK